LTDARFLLLSQSMHRGDNALVKSARSAGQGCSGTFGGDSQATETIGFGCLFYPISG
jgi:hypothetical protein